MLRFRIRFLTRLWCFFALGLLLVSLPVSAQTAHQENKRSQRHEYRREIDKLEEGWRLAVMKHDVPALDALLADDYIAIMGNGMILSKQQTLEGLRGGTLYFDTLKVSDRKVRFYGKTALVTSRAEVKGNAGDGDISGAYQYTRVYVRDARGNWKIVSFEASKISHNVADQ